MFVADLDFDELNAPAELQVGRDTQGNLGVMLLERGQIEEGEALLQRALMLESRLVADYPAVPQYRQQLARTHAFLGGALSKTDQAEEAVTQLRTAVGLSQSLAAEYPTNARNANDTAEFGSCLAVF